MRIVIALVVALTMAVAPASAQADLSENRTNSSALGTVSMPRSTDADASGSAEITANVTIDASAARSAGAMWILIGVGNDNASTLAVSLDGLEGADGTTIEAARAEGEGTQRAQWWLAADNLSGTQELTVRATAKTGDETTDVETLVLAMDDEYNIVNGANGEPLVVQSFTTVHASGGTSGDHATHDGTADNDTVQNETGDGTIGEQPDATGDELAEEEEQEATNDVPAPGAILAVAATGVAAVAVSLRRR